MDEEVAKIREVRTTVGQTEAEPDAVGAGHVRLLETAGAGKESTVAQKESSSVGQEEGGGASVGKEREQGKPSASPPPPPTPAADTDAAASESDAEEPAAAKEPESPSLPPSGSDPPDLATRLSNRAGVLYDQVSGVRTVWEKSSNLLLSVLNSGAVVVEKCVPYHNHFPAFSNRASSRTQISCTPGFWKSWVPPRAKSTPTILQRSTTGRHCCTSW